MTDTELSSLEAAAKAATPGPWHIKRGYCLYDSRDMHIVSAWENYSGSLGLTIDSDEAMANAKFLEATNPAAILSLVAELRQAKAERDWLADHIATLLGQKSYNRKEHWIKAAKEATCQKN